MSEAISPSLELWDRAEFLHHLILQIIAVEALQEVPHATVRALDGPGNPCVIGLEQKKCQHW